MAADKALIAGAAKVAGAQANLDYSVTKGLTDVGNDMEEAIQLNLKNLDEQETKNTNFQNEQKALVLDTQVRLPDILDGTSKAKLVKDAGQDYATMGFSLFNDSKAGGNTYNDEIAENPDFQAAEAKMQNTKNVALRQHNAEIEFKELYVANNNGRHIDPKDKDSILANAVWTEKAKYVRLESGNFGYNFNDEQYTLQQVNEAMQNVSRPDNSKELYTTINRTSEEAFKGAESNSDANSTATEIKRTLDPLVDPNNIRNAELFYIGQNPTLSVGALRGTFTNEKTDVLNEGEYNTFLSGQVNSFIDDQKNMHFTPPEDKIDEVDESRTSANNTANTMIGQLGKGTAGVTNFLTSFWEDPNQKASNTKVINNGKMVQIVTDQIQKVSETTGLPEFEEDGKTPIYTDVTRNYNLKNPQSLYNFVNQVINNSNLSTKVKNILKEKPASFWAASINNNN